LGREAAGRQLLNFPLVLVAVADQHRKQAQQVLSEDKAEHAAVAGRLRYLTRQGHSPQPVVAVGAEVVQVEPVAVAVQVQQFHSPVEMG
jgi:hypothetical protein